jgi:3-oxoacyl-[acyl-carrier-protein] synthase-3
MVQAAISGVKMSGICSAVPEKVFSIENVAEHIGEEEAKKIVKNTGVRKRHVVSSDMCTSDLCVHAAEKLMEGLNWDREEIGALVFVTQTPDYLLPATSCTLQHRLSLSTNSVALDINLGCSGYVYGLWILSNLMKCSRIQKGLLLAGDTISRICNPLDRSTSPLFGDSGTATALELEDDSLEMAFVLGTDGRGEENLIVPGRAFREKRSSDLKGGERMEKDLRTEYDLFMEGAEIFTFTLKCVPKLVEDVLSKAGWTLEDIDYAIFHQANKFILEYLRKKIKIPKIRFPTALEQYGNTSSASIPLTINSELQSVLTKKTCRIVLAGFGVGYSWAGAALSLNYPVLPNIVCCG